jgi:hypothetical protein
VRFPEGISALAALDLNDSFLANDGANLIFNSDTIEPGLVEIGISRDASDGLPGETPSGDDTQLARLVFFRIATDGAGPVTIEDASLFVVANAGDQPTEIVVPFSAGDFDIEN